MFPDPGSSPRKHETVNNNETVKELVAWGLSELQDVRNGKECIGGVKLHVIEHRTFLFSWGFEIK